MAITIPSRHIYDTPQNNKVKNNLIDHIVVNAKTAEQITDENYNIYSGSLAIDNSYSYAILRKNNSFDYKYAGYTESGGSVTINGLTCCYSEIQCISVTRYKNSSNQSSFTVEIPKSFNGVNVANLNKNGINIKFRGNIRTQYFSSDDLRAQIFYEGAGETETKPYLVLTGNTSTISWTVGEDTTESATYSFPTSIETTKQEDYVGDEGSVISTSTYTMPKGDIGDISINSTNNDKYIITFTNTGIAFKSVSIYGSYKQGNNVLSDGSSVTIPLIKEDKTYTALEAIIEINGKVIKIDLSDSEVNVPSLSGDKTFSVESNELLQTNNLYSSASAIQTLFNNTYNHYKNGKETAVILCDIADYFNSENNTIEISDGIQIYSTYETENGVKKGYFEIYGRKNKEIRIYYKTNLNNSGIAIIPKGELISLPITLSANERLSWKSPKMTFRQYDEVIPMIFGADGRDYPMSKDANGNAKVFVVLHTRIFYDGAVWQELTLQEK